MTASRIQTQPLQYRNSKTRGEVGEGVWLVSFVHNDPGYFGLEQKTLHQSAPKQDRATNGQTVVADPSFMWS